MKKSLLILLMPLLFTACSKKSDPTPVDDSPTRVELNIETLNSYIGQNFDAVHKTLEKNAFETKTTLGDRSFTIGANSGDHKGLSVELRETNKIISKVYIQYDGVVGGKSIGDPYENELWYYMLNKVQGLYGESSTRVYIKGSTSRILSSNEALIQVVKDNGYSGANYLAIWNKTKNVISVLHTDAGRFILEIKAQ